LALDCHPSKDAWFPSSHFAAQKITGEALDIHS
jgi:hypothetical protein